LHWGSFWNRGKLPSEKEKEKSGILRKLEMERTGCQCNPEASLKPVIFKVNGVGDGLEICPKP
jgi:hypothetical protein